MYDRPGGFAIRYFVAKAFGAYDVLGIAIIIENTYWRLLHDEANALGGRYLAPVLLLGPQ